MWDFMKVPDGYIPGADQALQIRLCMIEGGKQADTLRMHLTRIRVLLFSTRSQCLAPRCRLFNAGIAAACADAGTGISTPSTPTPGSCAAWPTPLQTCKQHEAAPAVVCPLGNDQVSLGVGRGLRNRCLMRSTSSTSPPTRNPPAKTYAKPSVSSSSAPLRPLWAMSVTPADKMIEGGTGKLLRNCQDRGVRIWWWWCCCCCCD